MTLNPVTVYAVSDAEVASFPVDVEVMAISTGIDDVETAPAFRIVREGAALAIYSDSDTSIDVFNIAGQLVRTLHLVKGRNTIDDLTPGVYVMRGQKVVF